MKKLITLITLFSLLVISGIPTLAHQFEYPANQNKTFMSEDEFYQQLKKEVYREFENATFSIRRKVSYKDTPDALMNFEKKTGKYIGQTKQKLSPFIHPERQVYFFASFVQTRTKEYWKYVIIDTETNKQLEAGTSTHSYDNPYN